MLRPKNLNIWSFFFLIGLVAIVLIFLFVNEKVMAEGFFDGLKNSPSNVSIYQETTFLPITPSISGEYVNVAQKVKVIVTAYSSSVWETDDSPLITASGETVRDGIIANNMLPFGTKVRMPELFGEKVFIVKDRMNSRKGDYHIDVWQTTHEQAKEFGAKFTEMEILTD